MSIRLTCLENLAAALLLLTATSCAQPTPKVLANPQSIIMGAERIDSILHLTNGKRIALATNHSGLVGKTHLVDTLLALGINVVKIFSPEHGFRGDGDAGETIKNHFDTQTGLEVVSLYGSKKKPSAEDLKGIDLVIFDMQDVGLRFYTYISTMHYIMEACAESQVSLLVLDRPNPNGFFVDGPILDPKYRSFVGMHPVPIVHGMTIGEYALMINGEGWLNNGANAKLQILTCLNYSHDSIYSPPVPPSPNLPNITAILLYPSLGFFEGTEVSIGRGTDFPFQVFGHPKLPKTEFAFIPESRPGASKNPPLLGKRCYGVDLGHYKVEYFASLKQINLDWLLYAYSVFPNKDKFFNKYFNTLAGTDLLQKQIVSGLSAEGIRASWANGIENFMQIRKKYLLYPDFGCNQ